MGAALSHGGSPKQKSQMRRSGLAAAGASAASHQGPGTEGPGGVPTTLVGCIDPARAMPLEREPVNSVPLKSRIKHTILIRD